MCGDHLSDQTNASGDRRTFVALEVTSEMALGDLECESCGDRHRMGERVFDADRKRMVCPACGSYPFTACRGDVEWHTEPR